MWSKNNHQKHTTNDRHERTPGADFASNLPGMHAPSFDAPIQPQGMLQNATPFSSTSSNSQKLAEPVTPPALFFDAGPSSPPHVGQQLQVVETETRKLSTVASDPLSPVREPLIIRGSSKKSVGTLLPPPRRQGKRVGVHVIVGTVLVCVLLAALMAVLPVGNDGHAAIGLNIFHPNMSMVNGHSNTTGILSAQAATATAVTVDGYDAGGNTTYVGVKNVVLDSAGGDTFAAGQCTYWASYRYHQLTGYWVPWHGNANQWYGGALASGWTASATPKVPSIIVLQAGVQGSSWGYGHVAIVESINADGSVVTSNWNWAGNWGRTTYVTFYPGRGVSFVYHP